MEKVIKPDNIFGKKQTNKQKHWASDRQKSYFSS